MKHIVHNLITAIIVFFATTCQGRALTINQEGDTWQQIESAINFFTMEVTPWGLYGGEFGGYPSSQHYNGVFFSRDLGQTWQKSGLAGRNVTDITSDNAGNLYAVVYYKDQVEASGLYKSSDRGTSWIHLEPTNPTARINSCSNRLILSTYDQGVKTSEDRGETWQQVPELPYNNRYYPEMFVKDSIVGISDYSHTFISRDCGASWNTLVTVPGYLEGLAINNNVWLTCNAVEKGLYKSTDGGKVFLPVSNWNNGPCRAAIYHNGAFYVSGQNNQAGFYNGVLKSYDNGVSWEEITDTSLINMMDLVLLVADSSYIYSRSSGVGLFRYKIPPYVPRTQAFLDKLWERGKMSEQTDSITSYFDHSYPLLAYPYKSEPAKETDTTLNFWGDKEKTPKLYYSSHDGVDFGLKYGTPILAPASGFALYSYTGGGGNTIKIDHLNGYQTQYLHLQKNDLFATSNDKEPKWIDKGQQIGLVGLTGNTTGPHLHFGVRYDKNLNGDFTDDVPDGRVDPYAWQDERSEDPWEVYSWIDAVGNHLGTASYYLWDDFLEVNSAYIDDEGGSVSLERATITVPQNALDKQITLKAHKSTQSNVDFADSALKYIQGTTTRFTAYDNFGEAVTSFIDLVDLSFDLSQADLARIIPTSLKILYFNSQTQLWEEIASLWDESTKIITGSIDHLSEFAVFGEKFDPNPPSTTMTVSGGQDGLWYADHPFIHLSATDGEDGSGVAKIFFSLDGGDSWEEYLTQTQIKKEGIFAVHFRSADLAENYEPAKDSPLLRVDTKGKFKDEVILKGGAFSIANSF